MSARYINLPFSFTSPNIRFGDFQKNQDKIGLGFGYQRDCGDGGTARGRRRRWEGERAKRWEDIEMNPNQTNTRPILHLTTYHIPFFPKISRTPFSPKSVEPPPSPLPFAAAPSPLLPLTPHYYTPTKNLPHYYVSPLSSSPLLYTYIHTTHTHSSSPRQSERESFGQPSLGRPPRPVTPFGHNHHHHFLPPDLHLLTTPSPPSAETTPGLLRPPPPAGPLTARAPTRRRLFPNHVSPDERFLKARKFDLDKAIHMWEDMLNLRKEHGADSILQVVVFQMQTYSLMLIVPGRPLEMESLQWIFSELCFLNMVTS
ncbi:uncharacterized protein LOC131308522 [Rhododendron vialii]|uniref:uncharacterized protein LOC131308522 n=1 Tax=Rhododendron vialii TaxID=182163 RepID=UPI00265FD4AA|nr:uncharacterized protein LOC131308522 [Rhododendron vialii]